MYMHILIGKIVDLLDRNRSLGRRKSGGGNLFTRKYSSISVQFYACIIVFGAKTELILGL